MALLSRMKIRTKLASMVILAALTVLAIVAVSVWLSRTRMLEDRITQMHTAVGAIDGITSTIEEVSAIAATIGSAIEEQGAATAEIARNVTQAAQATREVTANIGGVSTAANETGGAAGHVLSAATNLSKQAEQLAAEVNTFLAGVRAA